MRPIALLVSGLVLGACGGKPAGAPGAASPTSGSATAIRPAAAQVRADIGAELAAARAQCLHCHPAEGDVAVRLAPLPAPSLEGVGARRGGEWLQGFLGAHRGADPGAADLAAFLRSLSPTPGLRAAAVGVGQIERGERLWRALGCAACHDSGIADQERCTDLASTVGFLREPALTRPDLRAHDFQLSGDEAAALAAWLLRGQRRDPGNAPAIEGLAYECFETKIEGAALPVLDGLTPSATGITTAIDVDKRTRDNHFALRLAGQIQAPVEGDYRFVAGADDCVWLWIDDRLVVENAQVAPHRRREATVRLTAGWHAIRLVFTEVAGGESLELLWQAPGADLVPVPPSALAARTEALVPPIEPEPPTAAAIERGKAAWVAGRCGSCHGELAGIAPPAPARPWAALGSGACPQSGDSATEVRRRVQGTLPQPRTAAEELVVQMGRDGCFSCHVRDRDGGMTPAARSTLVEVEDLGDEGRLPPDLTAVGHRLQQGWIEGVLTGRHRVRPYLQVRMPRLDEKLAAWYADLFARIDTVAGDHAAPAFEPETVAVGQRLAGNTGYNCITCHTFGDHRSLGPQGMDLAIQAERIKPAWFREWLEQPHKHRPGTRMPMFWPMADDKRNQEIGALWQWLALGRAAPLPSGLQANASNLVLETGDRPVLHGAFLDGLSARCIAVATRERTHYAYDLAHARLAWLWRGEFLDAGGTWNGRAGQVLKPKGTDHVVLPPSPSFTVVTVADQVPSVSGWRLDADGHPIFQLRLGAIAIEDAPRPRWTAGGSELVRRVQVRGGSVAMTLPPVDGPVRAFVGDKPVGELMIRDGDQVEVIYRW